MNQNTTQTVHKSVLMNEVLQYLDPKPGGLYLDVTFGAGGHTRAILEREPTCRVVAFDWDKNSLDTFGHSLLEQYPDRLKLVWGNFALLYKLLKQEGIDRVDGILADFGTSQMQIFDRPGFSIYRDTALDMRMSPPHQKITAEEIINSASEKELKDIFFEFGQERYAGKIARIIVEARSKKRITTTKELAHIIERIVPGGVKRGQIHPATRVFQALRIFINKELHNIEALLPVALQVLKPNARIVCISFHSLEDRIVKQYFKDAERAHQLEILTPKVVTATQEELQQNPSSRSACLRAARKID